MTFILHSKRGTSPSRKFGSNSVYHLGLFASSRHGIQSYTCGKTVHALRDLDADASQSRSPFVKSPLRIWDLPLKAKRLIASPSVNASCLLFAHG